MTASEPSQRVAIIGGGLAGLAAAVGLAEHGVPCDLFESKRRLAGRAGSFLDPASGEMVDHCQHVSMGCCTNLADFCRRTGIADCFRRDRVLHFFSPDGRRYDLAATRWLPAPLHLAPAFLRLGYLSLGERFSICRVLLQLARLHANAGTNAATVGAWLVQQGQSSRAIERFWAPVLVSALGESIERASLVHARKVFVDGFMASSAAYEIEVPRVPLGELYGERLLGWLDDHGVQVHLGCSVDEVAGTAERVTHLVLDGGDRRAIDAAIVAVPWRRVQSLFQGELAAALPDLAHVDSIDAAPITGVHLWFDRPITPLPHAVLVGMTSQWLFNRGGQDASTAVEARSHYYQVVISASRQLAGQDRETVIQQIVAELAQIWPTAREAKLLHWRMVTEQAAVFSVRPGIEQLRPPQRTRIPNLALAGDWTSTGWPSTMEGAVRSGYLASETILTSIGRPSRLLVDDLPRGWLARMLLRGS